MSSWARSFLTLNSHQKPVTGDIKTSTVQADHMGWLLCDGREIDINTFYFLYQVIGLAYGTPSSSTKFKLPNASGRVPGFVGLSDEKTWILGDISGEENHTLTIAQMPAHNHGGQTDLSATLISIDASGVHTHGITDPGHAHSYVQSNNSNSQCLGSVTGPTVNDDVFNSTTGSSTTGISINSSGLHSHSITDPQHRHGIQSQGGDQKHNNVQPTIFVGNMFIYTGKPTYGTYPNTVPPISPYPLI